MLGQEAGEAEQVGPEILEKEQSPDPVLMEEEVDQKQNERREALGCSGPQQQLTDNLLTEGGLEKEEDEGSEQNHQRGYFALAGEWWQDPERGGAAGLACQPAQQQEEQALMGHRSAGQMSQSHFHCPVEGWECWEKSCDCLDRCLWCHCCHRPERCGFLKSSPPQPLPLPLIESPVAPGGTNKQIQYLIYTRYIIIVTFLCSDNIMQEDFLGKN